MAEPTGDAGGDGSHESRRVVVAIVAVVDGLKVAEGVLTKRPIQSQSFFSV